MPQTRSQIALFIHLRSIRKELGGGVRGGKETVGRTPTDLLALFMRASIDSAFVAEGNLKSELARADHQKSIFQIYGGDDPYNNPKIAEATVVYQEMLTLARAVQLRVLSALLEGVDPAEILAKIKRLDYQE